MGQVNQGGSAGTMNFRSAMGQVNPDYFKQKDIKTAQVALDQYNQEQQGFHPFEAIKSFLGIGKTLPEIQNAPPVYNAERNAQILQQQANAPSNWVGRMGNAIETVAKNPVQSASDLGHSFSFGTANLLADATQAVQYQLGGSNDMDKINAQNLKNQQDVLKALNESKTISPEDRAKAIKNIQDATQESIKNVNSTYDFANKDNSQIAGEAIGTLADYLTFGTTSKAFELAKTEGGIVPLAKFFASKAGLKYLAEQSVAGLTQFGLGGLGQGMQQKQSGTELAKTIGTSAATGAVMQPALSVGGGFLEGLFKSAKVSKLLPDALKQAEEKLGSPLTKEELSTLKVHLGQGVSTDMAVKDLMAGREANPTIASEAPTMPVEPPKPETGTIPSEKPTIKVYNSGKAETGFSTPNKEFSSQFADGGKVREKTIAPSDYLDTRIPEQRKQLEDILGKDKVNTMISRTENGLPNHSAKGEQDALINASRDAGYKGIVLSETDKTTKFNGKDVVTYADALPPQEGGKIKSPELTYQSTTGTAGLAKTVKSKAVRDKMIYGFDKNFRDLPEYDKVINKEQATKATDYVLNNYDEAVKVAMGEKKAPAGLLDRDVFVAMNEHATATKDANMIWRLANESKLVGESTGMGQENQALARLNPDSALSKMTDIKKSFIEKAGGSEKVTKVKNSLIAETKKINIPKEELNWNKFLETIVCK